MEVNLLVRTICCFLMFSGNLEVKISFKKVIVKVYFYELCAFKRSQVNNTPISFLVHFRVKIHSVRCFIKCLPFNRSCALR